MTKSNPMRWGILGCASIAEHVAPRIAAGPDRVLAAIASRSAAKAEAIAARYPGAHSFGSYIELLESRTVDAVYIPLPNAMHAEWAIAALTRGIAVLCEKPLAVDASEAEAIEAASAESQSLAMEAFMYRFHPQFDEVRRLLSQGVIGPVRSIDAVFTFRLDDEPNSIVRSAELGGGSLLDVGSYCVDAIIGMAGMPSEVAALEHRVVVDEAFFGTLRFADGCVGRFESAIDRDERHRLAISGTQGTIVLEDPWVPGDRPPKLWVERRGEERDAVLCPAADSTLLMVDAFEDAWRRGEEPAIPLSDSVAVARVVDRLRAACAAA